jgi:DNA-directed RNA polymerase specialized sigma subunit
MKRYEQDNLAWNQWNSSNSKKDLGVLFKRVEPIIKKEVSRWSGGSVAAPVLELEAKKIALNAFKNYNPSKSKLSTHLTNNLKGLSRSVYTYSNPARLPEHRMIKAKTFIAVQDDLTSQLGRIPTAQELSENLSWSKKEVGRMRNELRSAFNESAPAPPGFDSSFDGSTELDFIYHDLNNQDKVVFEHTTGYGGAPVLDGRSLVSKTGLTQGQISHSKRRIRKLVLGVRGH